MYYETRNGQKSMARLINEIETDPAYANIEIRLNTQATALLLADDHNCKGVQVRTDGTYTNVNAKAVLLATGGMATNLDLLSHYTNQDVKEKCIGIGVGQDGDGHLMVEQTAHGISKSVHPTGMFHNVEGFGFSAPLGVAAALQPDLEQYQGNPNYYKADTLEALAQALGVPTAAFVETVEAYEGNATAGTDDPVFGKTAEFMVPLGDGPYYAFRIFSGVCQTNGGIRVDEFCRVCDPYFTPITGLYAGGISMAGLNTEIYSPGTSQAAALWSGSKAARHVVENLLGGTVAPDWFGPKEYDGVTPQREGKNPDKPLLGGDFE
jgi:succinate dehydrogenase/fumarate reductase flavoprotein subunit